MPSHYRAVNTENSPAVICDNDGPGTVMAITGRQEDAEEIASALNKYQDAEFETERLHHIIDEAYLSLRAGRTAEALEYLRIEACHPQSN